MASSARPARRYPTDLTNRQWRLVEPLLPAPPAGPAGRPRKHPPREIVNAIPYHVRAGGARRMLPRDFPPWQTVYWYFTLWCQHPKQGSAGIDDPRPLSARISRVMLAGLLNGER